MASGFLALLDDIAVLARAAASSLDDLSAAAMKASAKSAGVVIDDAAVTPQYVQGVSPKRELHVIKRITLGSLRNKFLIILPAAMIFTTWAPWILPILLIVGGAYLTFEGAEKVLGWFGVHLHGEKETLTTSENPDEFENTLVRGAVRTDLILSTEIMLITLSNVDVDGFVDRLIVLIIVALVMTAVVYGAVAVLVKMDDIGLVLARSRADAVGAVGRGLVAVMPKVFTALSIIGTVAMLWVGGHILTASMSDLGFSLFYDIAHDVAHAVEPWGGAVGAWVADTLYSAVFGVLVGLLIVAVVAGVGKLRHREAH